MATNTQPGQPTVRVTLRRTFIYAGRSYGPGTVEIPEALAVSLGISAAAAPAPASAPAPSGTPAGGAADTGAPGAALFDAAAAAEQYERQSKPELEQRAAERGLTVTRADGSEGVPLKSDYVAALVQADAGDAAAAAAPSE